jgi:uncharacterized surface protein with fasciclin (FAS1) repeats
MSHKYLQILTSKSRIKNLACSLSFAGISTLMGTPILAQVFYAPLYLFQPQAGSNYPYRDLKTNLVNTLKEESNFVNLVDGLEETGLTETLQTEQYTVLAPTDAAFDALPDEVFDKLSEPENLTKVLQYHLVAGEVSEADITKGQAKTVEGNVVTISQDNNSVLINEAKANKPPIKTSNGVIIEIDKVLLPPGF